MSMSLSGSLLVTRDGTEQGGMRDAVRPQVGLALLQRPYDLVAFHVAFYTTKAVRFRRPIPAAILEKIYGTEKPKNIDGLLVPYILQTVRKLEAVLCMVAHW